jgi:glycosyltransferase involved in cell wall biosynthesis
VLWIGNWGNAEYLRQIISTLERLGREFRFVLRLVGGPDVFEVRPAGVGVEHLQWSQGREAEWLRDADIGIMPLYHREHEEGKCAFKIVQYFSAGLASVASPVGMNAALIRHGENGLLAESQEQWFESLRLLLGNAQLRRRLGTQGYLTYREQFTRDRAASAWIALLHRLAANSRGGAR